MNALLKLEASIFSRIAYTEPYSDWVTNENLFNVRFY